MTPTDPQSAPATEPPAERSPVGSGLARAAMFRNRLRKNLRRLAPWVRQQGIEAYRLYDRDIPEVGLAVDRYGPYLVVWEYRRSDSDRETGAPSPAQAAFLRESLTVLSEECGVPERDIVLKQRARQRGKSQYQRLGERHLELWIKEGGHRFLVNLSDYLDTGLFLDHRETRALVQTLASGRRVLNLFGYTGSFTIYAAGGGAESSLTLDLSATYLAWAQRNFNENRLDPRRHRSVRADALTFLRSPVSVLGHHASARGIYDLIVLDPPTFSNSKAMQGTLDVQRDHPFLIRAALALLAPSGILLFSCNHHRFTLRTDELDGSSFELEDVSQKTLPADYHDPRTHRCYIFHKRR